MDITGIVKNYHAGIQKAGRPSSKKEWNGMLSDSLRENIAGYVREDAAQGIYMGNKFLRKSEVAKVAPDRAGIPGVPADWGIGEQGGK